MFKLFVDLLTGQENIVLNGLIMVPRTDQKTVNTRSVQIFKHSLNLAHFRLFIYRRVGDNPKPLFFRQTDHSKVKFIQSFTAPCEIMGSLQSVHGNVNGKVRAFGKVR